MIAPPSTPVASPANRVQSLDARAKLLAMIAVLLTAVTTPPGTPQVFLGYIALLVTLSMAAGVPLRVLLARYMVLGAVAAAMTIFIPFLHRPQSPEDVLLHAGVLQVSRSGTALFIAAFSKASIGILCALLLRETTPFPELLLALERLHVPSSLVAMTAMTYRYLFVLADEALRLRRARDSRCYGGRWVWHATVVGHMIGSLFVRAHDRAERVYAAMLSRGFTGTLPRGAAVPLRLADYAAVAAVLSVSLSLRIVLT